MMLRQFNVCDRGLGMSPANRWFSVIGGVLMNLSLGALYGWSLYVPALQKDLNITRTEASDIFSLTIVFFAIFFLAWYYQKNAPTSGAFYLQRGCKLRGR